MLGRGHLRHRPAPSIFVTSAQAGSGATTIAVPAAAAAGDMAILLTGGSSPTGGAGGWSSLGSGGPVTVFAKKLVTADLGATLTSAGAGGGPFGILIYRGGDVVTLRAGTSGTSPISYAGLTKSRNSRCLVAVFAETTGGATDTPAMTPASFTLRGGLSYSSGYAALWAFWDAIAYTDNAAMSWTWTSGGTQPVFFLEIT